MGGWFFASVVILILLLIIGVLFRAIPVYLIMVHVFIILLVSFLPQSTSLRYFLCIPLISIFLFCLFMSKFPVIAKNTGKIFLTLSAIYVLWNLAPGVFDLDTRLPESYAPKDAKLFWKEHMTSPSYPSAIIIQNQKAKSIFWSGPTFSEIPVIVK